MNILQVSIFDINGGAERVALDLHHSFQELGHNSLLLVGIKRGNDPHVNSLKPDRYTLAWFRWRLALEFELRSGIQAMGFWMFRDWWRKNGDQWDVVHFHNLHSSYFDLEMVAEVSRTKPVVQTLHDAWQLTGHCAFPISCNRWRSGCGKCPDLGAYQTVYVDRTNFNWKRKLDIYKRSRIVLVTPSHWLGSLVEASFLKTKRCELIPYGIGQDLFVPAERVEMRRRLTLPQDDKLLLFVANGGLNATNQKDPELVLAGLRRLIFELGYRNIRLVAVGGVAELPDDIAPFVIQRDYVKEGIETYYQAADLYLHLTKADNLPLVVMEAMACGLPVITTDIGGCNEEVLDGVTGYVIPPGNVNAFTDAVERIFEGDVSKMSAAAIDRARSQYTIQRMTASYLKLFENLLLEKAD